VYLFSNSHSIILVLGKLLLRQHVKNLAIVGAVLGCGGGVLTTLDSGHAMEAITHPTSVTGPSTQGDLIALAGAFAGVSYLLCAKKLRPVLGVRLFLFLLATGAWLLLLPLLVFERERLGIDLWQPTHPTAGLLGWIHHLDIELYIVLVGSVMGTMGFIASMKYFEPLIISVAMLTEPVVATLISVFVGVEHVPGWYSIGGGITVLTGCLLVLLASHQTSTVLDVTDHVSQTKDGASALSWLRGPEPNRTSTYGSAAAVAPRSVSTH